LDGSGVKDALLDSTRWMHRRRRDVHPPGKYPPVRAAKQSSVKAVRLPLSRQP
jgi:hypothetical protein